MRNLPLGFTAAGGTWNSGSWVGAFRSQATARSTDTALPRHREKTQKRKNRRAEEGQATNREATGEPTRTTSPQSPQSREIRTEQLPTRLQFNI